MAREKRGPRTGERGLGIRDASEHPHDVVSVPATLDGALGSSRMSRRGFLGVAAAGVAAAVIPKSAESLVPSPESR